MLKNGFYIVFLGIVKGFPALIRLILEFVLVKIGLVSSGSTELDSGSILSHKDAVAHAMRVSKNKTEK